jgi:TolB-like protein
MSCGTGVVVKERPRAISDTKKILVLPFSNMSKIYGENVNVRCPVCGKIIMIGKVVEGVEHDLTTKLYDLLKERKDIQFIPPSQAEGVLTGLMFQNNTSRSEKDVIMEAGRKLDADAVIYGYVYRYEERIGTPYAIDSPASVAFDIHLIHATNGSLLWNGHFDETQQSLSENLFKLGAFIKRKAQWVSAHEMAITGLEEVMMTFPAP